jgi:endonuclease/exonuclease/phosphatase family metal-dependent hydrolase
MVVNTHLDHILRETREKQIQVLINEVKLLNQFPLIIMGDFNESPFTKIRENLLNAFELKDPWTEKNYPEETSHHGFKGDKKNIGDRIDWILIPKNFNCTELRLDKRAFHNGVYPSDHYPLLATVIPK